MDPRSWADPPERLPRRVLRSAVVGVAGIALAVAAGIVAVAPVASADAPPATIVSLTFDDGNADLSSAVSALAANGMHGTFFINSGFVGATGYLTVDQLKSMAAAGNEIGGHTVNHPDLTTLSSAEGKRQICLDRDTLTRWGFDVTDFAYPFASQNKAVQSLVAACGYNSARGLGDLRTRFGCSSCASAETMPPKHPFLTKALDEVDSTWTLQDLKRSVTKAEKAGGWVQLTFHHICTDTCDPLAIAPSEFSQFLQWLRPRATTGNTKVETVAEVIGKGGEPMVQPAMTAPAGPGINGVVNPGLETANPTTGAPDCFQAGGYGSNTPSFGTVEGAHPGTKAGTVSVTGYSNGDAKLLPALDLGQCSPTVVPGHTYSLREWYTSTGVTQFAVYLRDRSGTWRYWTSSPWFDPVPTWTQAAWRTPAIPTGTTGLSFGLNIFGDGTVTTDDYAVYDSHGAPPVPATAVVAKPLSAAAARSAANRLSRQAKGTIQVPPSAHTAAGG